MIEEVVPPLAPRSLASPPVVETSTSEEKPPTPIARNSPLGSYLDWLPDSMVEELRWVAHQEGRDIGEIVVSAVDEFLADHWVRDSEF